MREEKQRQIDRHWVFYLLEYEYFIKNWLHLSNLFLTAQQNRFWLLIGKAVTLAYQEEDGNWDLGVDISKYFCLVTDSAFLPKGSWNVLAKIMLKQNLNKTTKTPTLNFKQSICVFSSLGCVQLSLMIFCSTELLKAHDFHG